MKMLKRILPLIALWICTSAQAQDKTWGDIEILLKNGSAKELVKFCGNSVTIKLDGTNNSFSKAEAENQLRTFFLQNPPTNFSYVHQGSSNEGLKYSIGKYSMRDGSYRIVMFLKEKVNGFQLESISLTRE